MKKFKNFYSNHGDIEKKTGIPSSLVVDHRGSSLNLKTLKDDLVFLDITTDNENITFEPKFKSILKYFFGNDYTMESMISYFFLFKDNKIILFFGYKREGNYVYELLIVSFQETLTHDSITDIFELVLNTQAVKNDEKKKDDKIMTYVLRGNEWSGKKADSKTTDTLYLPKSTLELITSEMDKFMCFEKIYAKIGVPYKKGFLFYGPPGTGKTSTVKALAHKYNIPIFIVDVNNSYINDETIVKALNSISGTGVRIVLFEDIDSAFADKEKLKNQVREQTVDTLDKEKPVSVEQKCLTYSGLLNALDGVQTSQHGTIVIMTTNYHEKLGKALVRPGRIDYAIELTYCDHYQIVTMTNNIITSSYQIISEVSKDDNLSNYIFHNPYTPDELASKINTFADLLVKGQTLSTIEPCKLQVYILKYLDNIEMIFNNYEELFVITI